MDFGGDPCEIPQAFAGLHNKGVTFGSETMAVVLKLSDLVTYNSMVSGYSMTGQTDEALNVIRQMKNSGLTPNIVSWTALISGSCQNGYYKNAFDYCYQMHAEGVKPNSATIASLLRACSGLSDVFQKSDNRTSASWNSMIMGFSKYGHRKEAVSLFKRMQEEKINPDAITMTALLSGCKHSGLIDDGWRFFDSMETEYGITPTIQHYSCMVDLLGRAGYLDEAWDFIGQMPMKPDSTVWGALLGSCRIHGNIHLGEMADTKCVHQNINQEEKETTLLSHNLLNTLLWRESGRSFSRMAFNFTILQKASVPAVSPCYEARCCILQRH